MRAMLLNVEANNLRLLLHTLRLYSFPSDGLARTNLKGFVCDERVKDSNCMLLVIPKQGTRLLVYMSIDLSAVYRALIRLK